MNNEKYFVVGGAGFIGSHFVDSLLSKETTQKVTIFDNFSSGRRWHYQHHLSDSRLNVVCEDIVNVNQLIFAMKDHDVVIHLASNPDIAKASTEPTIDFDQGTKLTQNVVEAMRCTNTSKILYASGSGVYGDLGETEAYEDYGPMIPISTYGASKLAGEALIASYCYMFGLQGKVFRFGNVVGPRQTHGVCFDFIKRLLSNPSKLSISGNGTQSKSYIHVTDVVNAVLMSNEKCPDIYQSYNVATGDYITVHEIAQLVIECMGLSDVILEYSGGDRGWKGDVPIVRLNTDRIKKLGWTCQKSTRDALKASILEMLPDIKNNKM